MKINKFFIYLLLATFSIASCKTDEESLLTLDYDQSNTSNLKVVYTSAYLIRDSVQIKINDARVSNTFISSSTTFLNTPFPGGGLNTGGGSSPWYFNVPAGETKIFVSVPKKFQSIDSIIRFSGVVNLDPNKYYSAYITDTLLNANVVLTEDNLALPPNGFSRYKFVNLIPNIPAIDLYFKNEKVASNIPYKSVSPEFVVAYRTTGIWAIRPAGALPTSTALATYTQSGSIPNQRVLTVFAKGYSGSTGARSPIVSLLYNR